MSRSFLCLVCVLGAAPLSFGETAAQQDEVARIQERYRRSGGYLLPARINGAKYVVSLNTTCNRSIVGASADPDPFPGIEPETVRARSSVGFEDRPAYTVPFSVMGNAEKTLTIATADVLLKSSEGDRCAIVGTDYLRHFVVNCRPRSRWAEVGNVARPPKGTSAERLKIQAGSPWGKVELPGISQEVFISTGIPKPLVLLGETLRILERNGHARFIGTRAIEISGHTVTTAFYIVRRVKFKGLEFVDVPVEAAYVPAVGLGILDHFDWTLDFPNEKAWFKPHTNQPIRLPIDISGMEYRLTVDGVLEVEGFRENSVAEAAGLKVGDRIQSINGRTMAELSRAQVEQALGQDNATLQLRVLRGSETLNMPLKLTRGWTYPVRWPEEKIAKKAPPLPDLELK